MFIRGVLILLVCSFLFKGMVSSQTQFLSTPFDAASTEVSKDMDDKDSTEDDGGPSYDQEFVLFSPVSHLMLVSRFHSYQIEKNHFVVFDLSNAIERPPKSA